ncbi:MAG: hypothetical protein M3T56_02720 [Chloroflexota bacterium]|nr:hypothetical protein [Chloroflexota bacterium]
MSLTYNQIASRNLDRIGQLLEVSFRQLDVRGAAVLAHVFGIRGLRDRDDAVLTNHPRERDLHRRRVVALGLLTEH